MTKHRSDKYRKLQSFLEHTQNEIAEKTIEVERNNTIRKLKEGLYFKAHESLVIYKFVPKAEGSMGVDVVYALSEEGATFKHYEGEAKIQKNSIKVSRYIMGKQHSTIIQFQYLRFLD